MASRTPFVLTLPLALLALTLAPAQTQATITASETFSYADGTLDPAYAGGVGVGGVGWDGDWYSNSGLHTVVGGHATSAGSFGESSWRDLPAAPAATLVGLRVDMRAAFTGSGNVTNGLSFGNVDLFLLNNLTAGVNDGVNNFNFLPGSPLAPGIWYRFTAVLDYDNDRSRFWVDPVGGPRTLMYDPATGASNADLAFDTFGSTAAGDYVELLAFDQRDWDNIVVASDLANVGVVPEPATLLGLVSGLLLLGAGRTRRARC